MTERHILYSEKDVNQAITRVASEITAQYNGDSPSFGNNPLFIALSDGALQFSNKLMFEMRHQAPDFHPDMATSQVKHQFNYATGQNNTEVNLSDRTLAKVLGRHVILLENMLDMGNTVRKAREKLLGLGARYVQLAVLVEKDNTRYDNLTADYVGFHTSANQWLVGMGLADSDELNRWDPFISVGRRGDLPPQKSPLSV